MQYGFHPVRRSDKEHLLLSVILAKLVRKRQSNYVARNPGIISESGGDNEIWSFGEENYLILKDILLLRKKLKPYIAQLAQEAADKGTPIMRPMFYDFPQDKTCWEIETQYMFGPDYLVAPVMEANARSRKVYLPEGKWQNIDTLEVLDGCCWLDVPAPLDVIPAFKRV